MNKTAELVKEWADFEEKHPDAGIEDFCRFHLTRVREEKKAEHPLFDDIMPPRADEMFIKLIDRILKLYMVYVDMAMKGSGINNFDDFYFLNAVANLKEPKKTQVIYHNITELSSGLLIIDRLTKVKYITEHDDPNDKRSKRLQITEQGRKVLLECYERLGKVCDLFFQDIDEEDLKLCVQLTKNLEIKFSNLWQLHKGKVFEDLYNEIVINKGSL